MMAAVSFASICVLSGCASSGGAEQAPSELPAGSAEARALVERFDATLLDVVSRSRELGQKGREAALRPVVLESFDVPWIARACLGSYWDTLTPEQRETWVSTYTEFHIVAMAFNWRRSRGARFEYLGEAPAPNGSVLVKSMLDRTGRGADVRRDSRLRRTSAGWRIVDVFMPAYVSTVGMRRSEYLAVVARAGFDGLLEDMGRRIETRRSE